MTKLTIWTVKIKRDGDGRNFVTKVYATCKTDAIKGARERLGFQHSGSIVSATTK